MNNGSQVSSLYLKKKNLVNLDVGYQFVNLVVITFFLGYGL